MKRKTYPPVYFISGFLLIIACYFIFPLLNFIPFPINLSGIVVLASGFILVSKSYMLFQKNNTPHNFDTATSLIEEGIFRYSRNPMYLGMVLILLGLGICFGNIISLIIPLIFFTIIHFVFIPIEEEMMGTLFKDSYEEYKRRVRKWI